MALLPVIAALQAISAMKTLQNYLPEDSPTRSSGSGYFISRYYSKKYKSYIVKTTKGLFNERQGRFYPNKY